MEYLIIFLNFSSSISMDYVLFMNSNDNHGIDTDGDILQQLEEDILVVYTMTMVACNTLNLFNMNKLEEGG